MRIQVFFFLEKGEGDMHLKSGLREKNFQHRSCADPLPSLRESCLDGLDNTALESSVKNMEHGY